MREQSGNLKHPAIFPYKQFRFCRTTHTMQVTAVSVYYIITVEQASNI